MISLFIATLAIFNVANLLLNHWLRKERDETARQRDEAMVALHLKGRDIIILERQLAVLDVAMKEVAAKLAPAEPVMKAFPYPEVDRSA